MAKVDMNADGAVAPGTGEVQKEDSSQIVNHEQQAAPEHEMSDIEKQASALGWKPDHEGKTFVSADEYVRRQPLFERIERQNRELKRVEELARQTAQHVQDVRKQGYEAAIRDLENKRMQAVQVGDTENFKRVDAQIEATRNEMHRAQTVQQAPVPELQDFAKRNQHWYNDNTIENQEMKAVAEAVDNAQAKIAHLRGQKLDVNKHLQTIEEEVRKRFPHRFENQKTNAPSAVGRSTTGGERKAGVSELVSKLSPKQREVGEYFQKHSNGYTLEQYAKDLEQSGRLGK